MQSPTKLDRFEDYKTFPQRVRDTHQNETSAFFKDDWKVLKTLTLNLGLRWDWYGVPYDGYGLMPLTVGGPSRIFGISGNSFADWMRPGVRGELTSIEFVGKNCRVWASSSPRVHRSNSWGRTRPNPALPGMGTTGIISVPHLDSRGRFPGSAPGRRPCAADIK